MIRVDVPGVEPIAFAPHALERMRERRIALEAVGVAVRRNERKWKAACTLAAGLAEGAEGIRVVIGALTVVIGKFEGEVCIVTLYRDGEG